MVNEEENPGILDPEKNGIFSCPMCGSEVDANATSCPRCGAIFEQEEQVIPPSDTEGEQAPPPSDMEEEIPLPYGVEEEQTPMPETDASMYETTGEEGTQLDVPENEPEEEAVPTDIKSEEELDTDRKVKTALTDYKELRRKRYLFGALTLGLGLVLFVLLWLVVVYEVIVTETENWFGFEVIFILVGAGIFFILGLYLILTYPKSSLAELLSSMPMNVQAPNPEIGVGDVSDSPSESKIY